MTFTRRGVNEAITRAAEKFLLSKKEFKYFNTLHSAAFRHLGMKTGEVFTGKRVYEFGQESGYNLRGEQSSEDGTYGSFFGDDLILFLENYARVTETSMREILDQHFETGALPDTERAWKIINAVSEYKKTHDLLDFTDMIQKFIKDDDPPRLEVLMIDEAQDLSNLQWRMVDLLSRYVKRMYIAGDDDQTIFTWAGASEKFITMPGQVNLLRQSHRVPIVVHDLANRLIRRVQNRRDKVWVPRNAPGSLNSDLGDIVDLDPAFVNSGKSVMMLGRTVKLLKRRFVPYCRMHGILYRYFDYPSIHKNTAIAIKAWISLRKGKAVPGDQVLRVYDLLPTERHKKKGGIAYGGKSRLQRIAEQPEPPSFTMKELREDYGLIAEGSWSDAFTEIDPRDVDYITKVLENGHDLLDKPQVHISTIHRVKGGEANKVVLLTEMAKPSDELNISRDEETRVFYTGVTRTFEDLVVVQSQSKHRFDEIFE
jgi:DNA helicase-2/ATP-dependent DNA helicase PcrA